MSDLTEEDYRQAMEWESMKVENERLRATLEKYGRHDIECASMEGGYSCTCGLHEALKKGSHP